MAPPVALAKRWKKIKKRCSFSSGDRLQHLGRSKSFTEQDRDQETRDSGDSGEKYLTVGSRDARFRGIRDKIAQWNQELRSRRSTEQLPAACAAETADTDPMFVVATARPQLGRSAVVVSNKAAAAAVTRASWGEQLVSPPSPAPADSSYSSSTSRHSLYQDQDSGYDGFCPEKSLYSTTSSDTSSVLSSSEGGEAASPAPAPAPYTSRTDLELYARTRARPRPSPIYEKHSDYLSPAPSSAPLSSTLLSSAPGSYGSLATRGRHQARAHIAQATVVSLSRHSAPAPAPEPAPPPLPPRPLSPAPSPAPAPPIKPSQGRIVSGAISLPRRRDQFREAARRRGSYHDTFTSDKENTDTTELHIENLTDKVSTAAVKHSVLSTRRASAWLHNHWVRSTLCRSDNQST